MIIKFLKSGTGDPKLAVSYLLGAQDHLGDFRAEVEILRGDPKTFTSIAESIQFQYCYTSVVIAWSPDDFVSNEQLQEVLDLFEEHAFVGLSPSQYHMTAVMHADEDGSKHLHILVPRVELSTGKSLNIAPPGHHHYFDPLRDFLNLKYDWARPDDPKRLKTTRPKNHHQIQNAAAIRAKLETLPKKTRVELINQYIEQRIIFGIINTREDLINCLSELGEVKRNNANYISIKSTKATDRLKGEFYNADFSYDAYRKNREGQARARSILHESQAELPRSSSEHENCFKRIEAVRRKRYEYNKKYYRTSVSEFERIIEQQARLSPTLGATVVAEFKRERNHGSGVVALPKGNGQTVFENSENVREPTAVSKEHSHRIKQNFGFIQSNLRKQYSTSAEQCRYFEFKAINPENTEPNSNQRQSSKRHDHSIKSIFWRAARNNTDAEKAAIPKVQLVHWDIRNIQHCLNTFKFYLSLNIGARNERNTTTNSKEPINHYAREDDSRVETGAEYTAGGKPAKQGHSRSTENIYQRARKVAVTTEKLSRSYDKRKLSYDYEVERYESEVKSKRTGTQALSRRVIQGNFIQRTNRFFGDIKEQIRNTFRKLIDQFVSSALSSERSTDVYKRIEVKDSRTKLSTNDKFAMTAISTKLAQLDNQYPHLHFAKSLQNVVNAEANLLEQMNVGLSKENIDLYVDDHLFFIGKCLNEIKGEINLMGINELDSLKEFTIVIERYLDQVELNNAAKDIVIHSQDEKHQINKIIQEFNNGLVDRKAELIKESEPAKQNDNVKPEYRIIKQNNSNSMDDIQPL
ncbi:relaxase/mobilization nuclease domain-containing protein [Acinetobacter sp. YH12129]|uniref:relaxase/mobilization nuclease domain-containing protein n=1 Tax=Acinetobacter sp. YH12129 TaxID=2601114 RepID=UPI0015D1A403|nr:hypothetical protein [Acinetobacter sp. YH12129]